MGPKNWEAIGLPAYGTNHVLFLCWPLGLINNDSGEFW
jgi:hypothetical protein